MQGLMVPNHDPPLSNKGPRVALLGPIYADKLKAL